MSTERQMKTIDLETLDSAGRKVSANKAKKAGLAVVILLALAGGGYGAFRLLAGDVIASRFTVNQMTCPACVITVKEVTGKIPGVVDADVSLAAQDVTVRYRENRTGPDQIKDAIAKVGYPIKLDGIFRPGGRGAGDPVIAVVNGKPLFEADVKVPLNAERASKSQDQGAALFTVIGKELLLQAADAKGVVVQPFEIEAEVKSIFTKQGVTKEAFNEWMTKEFGSPEKYYQVVGQRLGIAKLIDETVLEGVKTPEEKERKTMEWVGRIFKDADVKITDPASLEKVRTSSGQDDWKTFWPRMIGMNTELRGLLVR